MEEVVVEERGCTFAHALSLSGVFFFFFFFFFFGGGGGGGGKFIQS